MPVYEYLCESCGHQYEKREGFEAPPLQACVVCGKRARRVLHAPPIVFKGSGFYVTDNRRDGHRVDASSAPKTTDKPAEKPADTPSTASSAPEAAAAG